jgi:hypothetical protein
MYFYAQINGAGLCTAVTQTAGPLVSEFQIAIASLDVSYLGRTYSGGVWT